MDVLTLRAIMTLDKSEYDRGLSEAGSNAESFGSKFGGKMKKVAKAGAVALGAFAVSSVKVGADFDKSMSQVAATMGYTVDELHKDGSEAQKTYQQLENAAREMGKKTKFSAQESAEALNYMALAGYDAKTSMDMLPKVLNLAAAGNMDLARASDMVTDTQSALGLSLDDTTKLIDQMARTSSKTNTSVEQLGDAFLTVGGTAKIMKGGTVEASAALGVLANAGIKGSEGGTALRNVLNGISSSKFEKSFGALGVSAYDAEGKMRNLKDILGDMNNVMGDMTDQEKQKIIASTFNVRDLKSVNALLAETGEDWDKLTKSIENSKGAAENMAEVQLDNLSGDVTILKSAFSELQITVSDLDGGVLRTFVQGMTAGINTLTDAINAGSFSEAFKILGERFNKFGDFVTNGLKTAIKSVGDNMPQLISSLMNGLASFSGKFREKAGMFISLGLKLIKTIAQGIIQNIPTFVQTVPTIITNFAGVVNDNMPKIIATGISIITSLIGGLIKAIPTIIANMPKIIQAIVSALLAFNWAGLGVKVIKGLAGGLAKSAGLLKSAVTKPISAVKTVIISGFVAAKERVSSLMESIKSSIKKKIQSAYDTLKSIVKKIKNVFPLSVGKIFSNLKIPHINISGGSPPFGIGGLGKKPNISVSWHRKAEETPYLLRNVSWIGANEGPVDEIMYGKKNLKDDVRDVLKERTPSVVINNYIDGAEDPSVWAMTLATQYKMAVRSTNGG